MRTQSALQNLGLNGLDNRLAYPGVGSVKGNGGYQFIERVDGGNGVGTKVRDESGKGTGNVRGLDDVPRIKEIEVNFKRNVKHDSEEFARQLKD
ncbi:hypothetical protein QNH32_05555 [Priestia flexa]|nr:hypothetical protein [Priestia flexa]WHX81028.1 hypothetical protein QNH32_05555 [Priestia flexa]